MKKKLLALSVVLAVVGPITWRWNADRVSDAYFRGDARALIPLADSVADAVSAGVDPGTGRFDGEWALVTCQMAILGLARVAERHPEVRDRYAPAITGCARWLLTPSARGFGTDAWGEDGLAVLDADRGHAYLGWLDAALATSIPYGPGPEVVAAHDGLVAALARRMERLPVHAFETYPGETYPADLAAVTAAVAIDGRHDDTLVRWVRRWRAASIDPATGLVFQSLDPTSGAPTDLPRGSSTAVSAWFLSTADEALAVEIAASARRELRGTVLGFGGVREVRRGEPFRMDIDSGPVVFGLGVSASGFGLADARILDDPAWHRSLYRSAHLVGLPTAVGGRRWYWSGGGIGNAILLAMLAG